VINLNRITNHNYAVNYGNTSFFQTSLPGPPVIQFLGAPFMAYTGSTSDDGPVDAAQAATWVPRYGRPIGLNEILDGTSNTLLMAEVIQGKGRDLRGFSWWGGASGFVTYLAPNSTEPDVITGGWCNLDNLAINPPCITNSTTSRPRMMGARSLHAGRGVQVSFCDGHVSYVPKTVNYNVWNAMGTSQGSEPNALNY
jgi:prepilin-type processing-associated H-X9-DG protein